MSERCGWDSRGCNAATEIRVERSVWQTICSYANAVKSGRIYVFRSGGVSAMTPYSGVYVGPEPGVKPRRARTSFAWHAASWVESALHRGPVWVRGVHLLEVPATTQDPYRPGFFEVPSSAVDTALYNVRGGEIEDDEDVTYNPSLARGVFAAAETARVHLSIETDPGGFMRARGKTPRGYDFIGLVSPRVHRLNDVPTSESE